MADCFREPSLSKDINDPIYPQKINLKMLPKICASLGKLRLTSLVTFTALGGYFLAATSIDLVTMSATAIGVLSCSVSANCFNNYLEYPFDSQMIRTRKRVLPMGLIKPENAAYLGILFGIIGCTTLFQFTSFYSGCLGLANIILYAGVYTPCKRFTQYNTHVGSLVGAIPPLIGWTAATSSLSSGAIVLATILYSWQFVHFNSLSWNIRNDYCKAGYQMMAINDISKLKNSTILHSFIVTIACFILPIIGIPNIPFIAMTSWINIYTIYCSILFAQSPNYNNSKKLFILSLVQITVIIGAIISLHMYESIKVYFTNKIDQN